MRTVNESIEWIHYNSLEYPAAQVRRTIEQTLSAIGLKLSCLVVTHSQQLRLQNSSHPIPFALRPSLVSLFWAPVRWMSKNYVLNRHRPWNILVGHRPWNILVCHISLKRYSCINHAWPWLSCHKLPFSPPCSWVFVSSCFWSTWHMGAKHAKPAKLGSENTNTKTMRRRPLLD